MRAVPPIRCPRCGFESRTISVCAVCGGKLRDAEGRVVPPLYAREQGSRTQRELASIVGLGTTGVVMVCATILAHGPIIAPIAVGLLTGGLIWGVARRRMRDHVTRALQSAIQAMKAGSSTTEAAIVRGRVHVLRSVLSPEGVSLAAYRQREMVTRSVGDAGLILGRPRLTETRSIVLDARERHCGGRFAVVGAGVVGIIDDDWLLVTVPGEPTNLVGGESVVAIADGDEVTVVGPATRGPAEDAARFVTGGDYRSTGDALIFDGHEGAPVVVIASGTRAGAR